MWMQIREGAVVARRLPSAPTEGGEVKAVWWIAAYIGSILAANWMTATFGLIGIGFGLAVTAGTFAAGASLMLRDGVQLTAGRTAAWGAIAVGVVLSYFLASPGLAVASAFAFAASEAADQFVFSPLRRSNLALAVLISSAISAPIDTVLFLWISGFGITWQAVLGQLIVKTGMALVAAAVIELRNRRACAT